MLGGMGSQFEFQSGLKIRLDDAGAWPRRNKSGQRTDQFLTCLAVATAGSLMVNEVLIPGMTNWKAGPR
jgi:hypothetical protein